jgi:hypothetical protein
MDCDMTIESYGMSSFCDLVNQEEIVTDDIIMNCEVAVTQHYTKHYIDTHTYMHTKQFLF